MKYNKQRLLVMRLHGTGFGVESELSVQLENLREEVRFKSDCIRLNTQQQLDALAQAMDAWAERARRELLRNQRKADPLMGYPSEDSRTAQTWLAYNADQF